MRAMSRRRAHVHDVRMRFFFFFGDEEWGDLSIMFSASKRAFRRGIFFPGTPLREAFRYCWVIQDLDY